MLIRDLFELEVTRDIPPVVYFHEQDPEKLANEVSEYIITGGWPEGHPNHLRVPSGIHEQYVKLLRNIASELDKPGGPELPTVWISGFYGSGKSSFAKLFGLALDGKALPDGTSLSEAWLGRDTSPKKDELRDAWAALRRKVDPLAVVFDVGGVARDREHIHAVAVRKVQERLGYCSTDPLVADFELGLERDGDWRRFEQVALQVLHQPWAEIKDKSLAEEEFSQVMAVMYPERYTDPMSWYTSRAGTHSSSRSPEEAVAAIGDMLSFRRPEATLFLVIDEVSQYVLTSKDRVDRLRAFGTALGATLKGKAWLLALGQQKLDEAADESFLIWAKDRFPPKLRVHLAATNIRDVVHKRLLQKKPHAEAQLRDLFERHRPDLKLYAYECDLITVEEFVEVYPMLPSQIDLILQLTSALRTHSSRAQGDDQAIRGLLQLLGELFRDQKLADRPLGDLVTVDQIYEVQHTALDSDVQDSMARILNHCTAAADALLLRAAKVVALLELIQDTLPTTARLVAQCLYDRVDRGNLTHEVEEALEELRRRNLLGFSEKLGYKIQSSAAEEWERERRDTGVPRQAISDIVQDGLKHLLAMPDRPRLEGRPFPWAGVYSDGRQVDDVVLLDPRDAASIRVDFRHLVQDERIESHWTRRSGETELHDRLVWVAGETDQLEHMARELHRSRAMVKRYKPRRESLKAKRKLLLQQEENRIEDLGTEVKDAVAAAWMAGRIYFRGQPFVPSNMGASFALALQGVAARVLRDLFPYFVATQVQPSELLQLVADDLSGPSPKFLPDELGILELDAGRYVPACSGVVPRRVQEALENAGGLGGTALLTELGSPPYGYTANVVRACVAGLLRASKVKIQPESGAEITAVRDAGVRDLFDKDRAFRRATFFPAGEDDVGFQARARICKFFEKSLRYPLDREDHAIADAVALHFPRLAATLRSVQARLNRLPGSPSHPATLERLGDALEQCIRTYRQTKPTVLLVKRHLDVLRDGVQLLQLYDAELTDEALAKVRRAQEQLSFQAAQLQQLADSTRPASSMESAVLAELDAAMPLDILIASLETHLESERPWRDIDSFDGDLDTLRQTYAKVRQGLLQWQEEQADQARERIRGREGFSTLTGESSHRVLRPLSQATTDTTVEAVAPTLADLEDRFLLDLQRAEEQANDLLDELLSQGEQPLIQRLDLELHNRELRTEAEVEALLDEVRGRLLEAIRAGVRVRLL